jgi:hypothetical protein
MAAIEPPRAALAMTAVLPSTGSTLSLAGPALGFPLRSRRTAVIGAGAATLMVAVALLFLHRSPGDLPAVTKPPGASAPLAILHETPGPSPTMQPPSPAPETARARPAEPARAAPKAKLDVEHDADGTAAPRASAQVRTAHHAAAHERRYAKNEKSDKRDKRGKRARHERRSARRTEVASRAAASPAGDAEARASYQRGNTLLFSGDAAGAVAAYRKAVELAPADPIGYRGLGLAHEQQGETGAAIRALRTYLKLAPGAADHEIISRRIARLSHAAGHP